MSYRCEFCGSTVPKKVSCRKVTVSTYMKKHPFRPKSQKRWVQDKTNGKMKLEWVDDPGGIGPQIAREVNSCDSCASRYEKK